MLQKTYESIFKNATQEVALEGHIWRRQAKTEVFAVRMPRLSHMDDVTYELRKFVVVNKDGVEGVLNGGFCPIRKIE